MRGARRHVGLTLILILLAAPTLVRAAAQSDKPAEPVGGMVLDRVLAVVDDEALTLSELQEEGQPVVRKIFQDFVGPERDRRLVEAQKQLLDATVADYEKRSS